MVVKYGGERCESVGSIRLSFLKKAREALNINRRDELIVLVKD